jgi:hypothetical protein
MRQPVEHDAPPGTALREDDKQPSLFGDHTKPRAAHRQAVRNTDDVTSRFAIDKITNSGYRASVNQRIFAFLHQADRALTYREIARAIDHDAVDVMRRLNDRRIDGQVEKCGQRHCTVNGNLATLWRATL